MKRWQPHDVYCIITSSLALVTAVYTLIRCTHGMW